MKRFSYVYVGLFTSLFFFACQKEKPLFEQMSPSQTGIDFSNRITESDTFNILTYEYVYNGGGVGIGDFNADGLQDVFFSGNMTGNKLYLNQGEFKFLDITEQAGVDSEDQWNSGVAVVDINNDGWLDLYVCATTLEPGSNRANRLFLNNGLSSGENVKAPSFTEQAAAYGIADESHTTNAAFFDYDNDGDLDLYLLVNQMDENAVPSHFRKKVTDGTSHRTDKLFRNDFDMQLGHPVFTDVSKEAGIEIEGYGLGLNICDINRDGWKDIYVSNDYLSNDLFWINQQGQEDSATRFENKATTYLKHTSYSAMGNNVGDLNNDGLADIVAVDMLPEDNFRRKTMLGPNNYMFYINNDRFGYQYQYVRNTLQLNQGINPQTQEPIFSEISMLSGMSSTDWSWTPLMADFDNDGKRDLIITNGFPKDVTDRDFMEYNRSHGRLVKLKTLEKMIPSIKISNYAFRNALSRPGGIPSFEDVSETWGFSQPSFSNGAVYADLDNDGDLDVIMNNINDSAFVYRNTLIGREDQPSNWLQVSVKGSEQNLQGLGAIIDIYYQDGQTQSWEHTPYRGYLSSVEAGAHFGLGSVSMLDSLVITWQEGARQVINEIAANQRITLAFADASPSPSLPQAPPSPVPLFSDVTDSLGISYRHREIDYIDFNVQKLLLHKLSQYGPGLAVGDVNGDGQDDLYVGGSEGRKGQFLIQQLNGTFATQDLLPVIDEKNKYEEELGLLLFDADNDGDNDLYVVSGGYESEATDTSYQDRLFLNEDGRFQLSKKALPSFISSGSCVRAADMDQDGDLDLFVGGRVLPHQYPTSVSSYLLINDGTGKFSIGNETSAPALNEIGMVCDALWTDVDQDGWVDLMLAGEWMPLQFLHNQKGKLIQQSSSNLSESIGFWNSLAAADFDLDGDMDYIAGNLGSNTLLQASDEYPVSIYHGDFYIQDEKAYSYSRNSKRRSGLDAIPTAYFPDTKGALREYPFFGKSDMEKQLITIKKLYLHHHQFAMASMPDILQQFPTVEPSVLRANETRTLYIENLGEGKFASHPLPAEAQIAPAYGMIAADVNGDNLPDICLIGNDYGVELSMGKSDALNGLILLGDGKGGFHPISLQESGMSVLGDGKSLVRLLSAKGQILFAAGQNQGPLKMFQPSASVGHVIPLTAQDCSAIVQLRDGRSYRQELYYGQGFLSQSARRLFLPEGAVSYEIVDFLGNKTKGSMP